MARTHTFPPRYAVHGIPTLVVLDATTGELVSGNGRDDIDPSAVAKAAAAWSPEGRAAKALQIETGRVAMTTKMPRVAREALGDLGITGPVDAKALAQCLAAPARAVFARAVPAAVLSNAASVIIDVFESEGSKKYNRGPQMLDPEAVVAKLIVWLGNIHDPDEVKEYTSPKTIRKIIFMETLEESLKTWTVNEAWAGRTREAVQCEAIFHALKQGGGAGRGARGVARGVAGDGGEAALTEGEFLSFLQRACGEEHNVVAHSGGIYNYLTSSVVDGRYKLSNGGEGITAEVLFKYMYHEFFAKEQFARQLPMNDEPGAVRSVEKKGEQEGGGATAEALLAYDFHHVFCSAKAKL